MIIVVGGLLMSFATLTFGKPKEDCQRLSGSYRKTAELFKSNPIHLPQSTLQGANHYKVGRFLIFVFQAFRHNEVREMFQVIPIHAAKTD
jgi:hypothetical protein